MSFFIRIGGFRLRLMNGLLSASCSAQQTRLRLVAAPRDVAYAVGV